MIFQHTIDKVLSGEKTMTRRLAKPEPDGTTSIGCEMIQWPSGVKSVMRGTGQKWYKKWQVGHLYAVCPGRGKEAVAYIQVVDLRREDVRNISDEDAKAEGFSGAFQFLWVWTSMHDKPAMKACKETDFSDGDESGYVGHPNGWMSWLRGQRPAERYQAWVIEFKLVTGEVADAK